MLRTVCGGVYVRSEAGGVRVMSGNVSGTGRIKGFNINESVGKRAIKASKHNVRDVRKAGTRSLHPRIQSSMPPLPAPLSNHPSRPKDGI